MIRGLAAVLAAVVTAAAAPAPDPLGLPFSQACISSPFGARGPGGRHASQMHGGIDIPAAAGTHVHAAAAGTVTAIRRHGATGLEVDVRHAGGMLTRYAHLGIVAPAFASGKHAVAQGEVLGRVGRTGVTYGTHLHFEVELNGTRVDPAPYLGILPCPPARPGAGR